MLIVHQSPTYIPERTYITNYLLKDLLGVDFAYHFENRSNILVTGPNNKHLILPDVLFKTQKSQWLSKNIIPKHPLTVWNIDNIAHFMKHRPVDVKIPVIFGFPCEGLIPGDFLPVDIFGSAFFMLTRYEEIVDHDQDSHGRFLSANSIAFKNGFLNRPIINEYVEILWFFLKRLWPTLERKKRDFRNMPTCDVDIPFEFLGRSFKDIFLRAFIDLYHGIRISKIIDYFKTWKRVNLFSMPDPYDNFAWMMNTAERKNLKICFNFMSGGHKPEDYYYSLKRIQIKELIQSIIHRGHEIGFHPSYNTVSDQILWEKEFIDLKSAVNNYRIRGGRQHFLRFKIPDTWRLWAENGMDYDSTLSYADHSGFRCGICYEYPVFDVLGREVLPLLERPLIFMDVSVIDEKYMGLGTTRKAEEHILYLKKCCNDFNGDFNYLWHNQRLQNDRQKEMFKELLD